MTAEEEKESKEEFEEYIKREIEGIEYSIRDNDFGILWIAAVHEATRRMLKERNLTPLGAFKKWKER